MSDSVLFTTFDQIESKEPQWLWKPYIPLGHLTLVYGDDPDDVRKFLLELASRISRGQVGDEPEKNKRVHFEDGEKNPGFTKGQIEARGGDISQISYLISDELKDFFDAKDDMKEAKIKTIILSSVEDIIITTSSVKSRDLSNRLKQLMYFARDVDCAMILGSSFLHPKHDELSRYLAETMRRMPRSVLEIEREGNNFKIHQIKNNLAALGEMTTLMT